MKVLIVMPSGCLRGGAEEALLQLLEHREIAGLGDVSVIFLEQGELVETARRLGIDAEVISAGRLREFWRYWRCVKQIRDRLKRARPDVVLGWMTKAHLYSGLAAWLAAIPAFYFQMGNPDGGIVDRLCRLIPAGGALACSEFVARQQRTKTKTPVVAVALGMDDRRFGEAGRITTSAARVKVGLQDAGMIVGMVGRLQKWKGMHIFVEAMRNVTREFPNCTGVIVGGVHDQEPHYQAALHHRVEALGLQKQVQLVGKQSNVPEWMQAMDVVVHASDREPFGIVVVEAMALGKSVVATSPGGPEEIITDEADGLLVPFGDATALAGAIKRYLMDAAFASQCGALAKRRASEFTAARYAGKVGMALRALLNGNQHEVAGFSLEQEIVKLNFRE